MESMKVFYLVFGSSVEDKSVREKTGDGSSFTDSKYKYELLIFFTCAVTKILCYISK